MTKIELIKQQIKEEITRLEKLEKERVLCKDYSGALRREAEREACMRIFSMVCGAEDMTTLED